MITDILQEIDEIEKNSILLFDDRYESFSPLIWLFYVMFDFNHDFLKDALRDELTVRVIDMLGDTVLQKLPKKCTWESPYVAGNKHVQNLLTNNIGPHASASHIQIQLLKSQQNAPTPLTYDTINKDGEHELTYNNAGTHASLYIKTPQRTVNILTRDYHVSGLFRSTWLKQCNHSDKKVSHWSTGDIPDGALTILFVLLCKICPISHVNDHEKDMLDIIGNMFQTLTPTNAELLINESILKLPNQMRRARTLFKQCDLTTPAWMQDDENATAYGDQIRGLSLEDSIGALSTYFKQQVVKEDWMNITPLGSRYRPALEEGVLRAFDIREDSEPSTNEVVIVNAVSFVETTQYIAYNDPASYSEAVLMSTGWECDMPPYQRAFLDEDSSPTSIKYDNNNGRLSVMYDSFVRIFKSVKDTADLDTNDLMIDSITFANMGHVTFKYADHLFENENELSSDDFLLLLTKIETSNEKTARLVKVLTSYWDNFRECMYDYDSLFRIICRERLPFGVSVGTVLISILKDEIRESINSIIIDIDFPRVWDDHLRYVMERMDWKFVNGEDPLNIGAFLRSSAQPLTSVNLYYFLGKELSSTIIKNIATRTR